MFDNVALNVFICLSFIFLLYSLLATIFQEILAQLLSLRGRMLQKALRRMLQDDGNTTHTHGLFKPVFEIWDNFIRFFSPYAGLKNSLFNAFYQYPSIKYLAESNWNNKPSYIDATSFSQTMFYLLLGDQKDGSTSPQMDVIKLALFTAKKAVSVDGNQIDIQEETLKYLQKLFLQAQGDGNKFRILLEQWFNTTMDRVCGWYKRQNQFILFFTGIIFAIFFNVDTIAIYKLMSKDNTARNNLVQLAISSSAKYQTFVKGPSKTLKADTTKDSTSKKGVVIRTIKQPYIATMSDSMLTAANTTVQNDINKAQSIAALGWPDKDSCARCDTIKKELTNLVAEKKLLQNSKDSTKNKKEILSKQQTIKILSQKLNDNNNKFDCLGNPYQNKNTRLLGWLLTAFAISLGAPFWFDLLNRFIQLRGTGTKPDATNDKNNTSVPVINRVG